MSENGDDAKCCPPQAPVACEFGNDLGGGQWKLVCCETEAQCCERLVPDVLPMMRARSTSLETQPATRLAFGSAGL